MIFPFKNAKEFTDYCNELECKDCPYNLINHPLFGGVEIQERTFLILRNHFRKLKLEKLLK